MAMTFRKAALALAAAAVLPTAALADVTYTFSNSTYGGYEFESLTALTGPLTGTLTAITANWVLDAQAGTTWAADLSIVAEPSLLQVGGWSSLGYSEYFLWATGRSTAPGTPTSETYTLNTPLNISGVELFIGNGWNSATAWGTWSGSVTLHGVSPIPEPSTWALMLAGAAGLVGWVGRRRRAA